MADRPLPSAPPREPARSRTQLALAVAALAGLALYAWCALAAPVVMWSDSRVDMERVHRGIRSWTDASLPGSVDASIHPVKPGYLLFLDAARFGVPSVEETRSVVIVQSVLLWLSIAGASLLVVRHRGVATGAALYAILLSFLRLRDSASAVMSEAVSAAAALALIAMLFALRREKGKGAAFALWGVGAASLFWIRPNIGAFVLAIGLVVSVRQGKRVLLLLLGFAAVTVPVWMLVARGRDGTRGLATPVLASSIDYYWSPWPPSAPQISDRESSRTRLRLAMENWRRTLSLRNADARRQIVWRAFHGFFATEFYDSRWSAAYRNIDTAARTAAPLVTLAAIAVLLCFPFRGADASWNAAALLLLSGLVLQNLLLGSHPRYVLPLLPVIILMALMALRPLAAASPVRWAAAAAIFGTGLLLLGVYPGLLDWEWGRVEAAGLRLHQRIPRGSLPRGAPATLHLRIAPPLMPADAHLEIFGPGSRVVYSSAGDPARDRPFVTIAAPDWLLEANRNADVELDLVSRGSYDDLHYLLFPVVPRPWSAPVHRDGGELSPSTGIAAGSLDWWAHPGIDAFGSGPVDPSAPQGAQPQPPGGNGRRQPPGGK